MKTIISLL